MNYNSPKKAELKVERWPKDTLDEGQDFESEWLSLVGFVLNENTQSLLLVEDCAQTIYKRKRSLLKDTGLSFQGRSKVLSINYRNTAQIVRFAWDFYRKHSVLKNKVKYIS